MKGSRARLVRCMHVSSGAYTSRQVHAALTYTDHKEKINDLDFHPHKCPFSSCTSAHHGLHLPTSCASPRAASHHELHLTTSCISPRAAPHHGLHLTTSCTSSRAASHRELHLTTSCTSAYPQLKHAQAPCVFAACRGRPPRKALASVHCPESRGWRLGGVACTSRWSLCTGPCSPPPRKTRRCASSTTARPRMILHQHG